MRVRCGLLLFYSKLDTCDHRPLALNADLLRALERDERELEVVRSLLQ